MKQIKTIELESEKTPCATDIDQEREILSSILDEIEYGYSIDKIFNRFNNVTEWVVWQLGISIHYYLDKGYMEFAYKVGILSILFADKEEYHERSCANRNSLAILLFSIGEYIEARSLSIISRKIAQEKFLSDQSSSLSILANIEYVLGNYYKAISHWNSLFRLMKNTNNLSKIKEFAEASVDSFREANDLAGAIFCSFQIKGKKITDEIWDNTFTPWFNKAKLEGKINLYTRLVDYNLEYYANQILNKMRS